jgi:Flp pilus assembly protein TadD
MSAAARRLLIATALAVGVAVVFGRAAGYGFIELDDRGYVVDNPMVQRGLTADGVVWAFTTFKQANWHPLTWISLMADASLGGGRPRVFHVANVVYHALATVFLFLLLVRLTGRDGPSAAVAVLFALHPLRVESVIWIAERKDVLSHALGFAALYAWAGSVGGNGSRSSRWWALGLFAAGLLAKPMLITLPVAMLLLDRWPLARFELRSCVREKLPFFALSAASAVVTFIAQSAGGAVSGLAAFPLGTRVANACVSAVDYLLLTVWPHRLALPYPYDVSRLTPSRVGVSALVLIVLSVLASVAWKKHPMWTVAWSWYLVTLAPVIGIVQVGSQSMADRYTYLPLVGPLIAIVWWAAGRLPRIASVAVAAIATAALAYVTIVQASLWRDSVTLFSHSIAMTGPNPTARYALGLAYYRNGALDQSITELKAALAVSPGYADAWAALGESLGKAGREDEALDAYRRAVSSGAADPAIREKCAAALTAAGARRMRGGDVAGADKALREAVAVGPGSAVAHATFGVLLARIGRLDEAEIEFSEAVRLDPGNPGFASNLARVRAMKSGDGPR